MHERVPVNNRKNTLMPWNGGTSNYGRSAVFSDFEIYLLIRLESTDFGELAFHIEIMMRIEFLGNKKKRGNYVDTDRDKGEEKQMNNYSGLD